MRGRCAATACSGTCQACRRDQKGQRLRTVCAATSKPEPPDRGADDGQRIAVSIAFLKRTGACGSTRMGVLRLVDVQREIAYATCATAAAPVSRAWQATDCNALPLYQWRAPRVRAESDVRERRLGRWRAALVFRTNNQCIGKPTLGQNLRRFEPIVKSGFCGAAPVLQHGLKRHLRLPRGPIRRRQSRARRATARSDSTRSISCTPAT